MKTSQVQPSSIVYTSGSCAVAAMLRLAIASCLLVIMLSGCRTQTPPPGTDEAPATMTESAADAEHASEIGEIAIKIDRPTSGGEESAADEAALPYEKSLEVAAGTTLEAVMRQIKSPKIEISGSGTTAFVQSIDGVGTSGTHAWTFTIDGEFATQGIGVTELTPGQKIRWRFTTFEEAMQQE